MPIASAGPAPPDNRHLAVTSLSRNDSLKSERSDKRVSFNNDVGIKHIPRGGATKQQAPHPPPQKAPPDEWDECKPVKLQPTKLTAEELEREAANLVDLVDSINCKASPLPSKKHKEFTSRSLDRSQKRSNNSRNGLTNGGVNYTRITNPIIKHLKADVNRRDNRRRDVYSDSDSDRNRTARHKSVPNLVAASSYNNNTNPRRLYNGIEPSLNYTSVDNLLDEKNTNIIHAGKEPRPLYNSTSHHSADNLLDAPADRSNLIGFKSLGSLPHVTDSDSTDMSYGYRPKVNQIIQRLNGDSDHQRYRSTDLSSDRELSPSRGVIAPTRRQRHNHNKPFSYTGPKPVASLKKVRQSSPSREINSDDMYAQVNKHGIRQRLSADSDYSAKIIITEDRPRNSYEGDDEAYETYQVQNNSLRNNRYSDYGLNLSRDDINSKNNAMNNNINMSSVAVQTDTVNKALNKDRRFSKGMAPQPPINEPYRDNYRSRKDLGSELTSADLVRQVNHGFGRFDRSPSPPPRKAFNRSNPRHVIPLLSDTSDSEPEYRRRSDPLAKIRNQVLMGERLQEEHDAEEWEEREMAQYERDKRNLNYNPTGMRPLTIDEVEALSLELDQHGDRKLVVSQKSGEKRSSSQQTAHSSSHMQESHGERSYSEDRSRPIKPLREKSQPNRDSSESRLLTLERNKKNNIEKEKLAQEKLAQEKLAKEKLAIEKKAKEIEKENEKQKEKDTLKSSKGKDKKVKEPKEKKKKRIKIKFFYDPKPQDKVPEDPLKRYTEYKGTDRKEEKQEKVTASKTTRSRSYDSRSQSRERRVSEDPPVDPAYARDSSRERTLSRPDRSRKPASSTNRLHVNRAGSGNDPSSHEDSNDDRRRVRSTDSYDKRDRYENRMNYDSRDDRRTKYEYDDKFDRNRRRYEDDDDRDKRYDTSRRPVNDRESYDRDRNRYDDYSDHQRDEATERRNTFLERRELYERRDSSVGRGDSSVGRRDSRDTKKDSTDRSYSTERRGLYRGDDEPDRVRRYEAPLTNGAPTNGPLPVDDKNTSSPDEEGKQERVQRQRKKFLSAFMSDGRAKSSNVSSSNTKSGALAAPKDTSYSNNISSSTLKRSQSSVQDVKERERGPIGDTGGHESDPPPSVVPATSQTDSPKNKQNSKNAKKKTKKKSWSWGFLGLRGNRRKKGVPSSGAGSEVGSVSGGVTPRRAHPSRPSSRASSHRSSTRPARPSVRASKIRKDTGEGRSWSSRVHEQRETARHWESATLQRPVGLASRDKDRRERDVSDDRRGRLNGRGPRRTSEGSSGSSAGPARNATTSRVGRTKSFKQRYFGDSDHEPPRPRNSGPGDYRSLPNRTTKATSANKRGARAAGGGGSAGSSLQSSESENDSHQGSRASHVSTGSNRSVYLHAMAVADIPVQKDGETSDKPGVQRQTRKVTRSFSLLAPWKPKHAREPTNIEYDNRETRHAAKPPRPPRRSADNVGRSQTLTNKDSKLSGWLKKRKSKEGKGI